MDDLEKATDIVTQWRNTNGAWVGPHGQLDKNVAHAVSQGIKLGRKEGLELARSLIAAEIERKNA